MSNSFNISDKPEIAANLVQILSNSSALATIQITDLPAIVNEINANQVFIEAIIDTHLPGIITEIDANETKIDLIRGTDVVNIQTNIDANETKIDAIQTEQYFSVLPADTILLSADAEQSVLGLTYTKVKEIFISFTGYYRITFDLKSLESAYTGFGRIYKDGVAFGIEQSNNTQVYANKSEDLEFSHGELLQLYLKSSGATESAYAENLKLKGTIGTPLGYVVTD